LVSEVIGDIGARTFFAFWRVHLPLRDDTEDREDDPLGGDKPSIPRRETGHREKASLWEADLACPNPRLGV